MGFRPSINHSLERRDNDKGYFKENCYWATRKEQNNNLRRNVVIEYDGKRKTVTQWSDELKIPRHSIYSSLKKGMDISIVLNPISCINQ